MTAIKDKVCVVTGAASGIGRATAVEFASRGARAVVICDLDEAGLEETANLIRSKQVAVTTVKLDVSDRDGIQKMADDAIAQHGQVDIVLNNAGVTVTHTVEDMTQDDFDWLMGINFNGMVYGSKIFLDHMKARGTGHIANVSSIFGMLGVPGQSSYCASKFGIRGFTEALAAEMAGTDIGVTCIHPGGIKTNIAANARRPIDEEGNQEEDFSAQFEKIARTTPEQAGVVIANGIEKNTTRLFIGADAKWADRFQRWFPGLYLKLMARIAKRQRDSGGMVPNAS